MSLAAAIETFARGFAFTRSFTHPYLAERVGPLWVTRDGPGKRDEPRKEEWIAAGMPPDEVVRIAEAQTRGRYAICHIRAVGEDDGPLRSAYKGLGYQLRSTEPVFTTDLKRLPRFTSPARIERLRDEGVAQRLADAARCRQILPEHLAAGDAAPIRQYVALGDNDIILGWVRSIVVGSASWVSNLHVQAEHRRRGIGSALMAKMLRDDRSAAAIASTLTASHTGAKLYPRLGYRQIGELFLYVPKK